MRDALKQLRKQRAMLDRAIRALEELEKLQAAGQHPQPTSTGKTMPGGLIVIRGGSQSKASRPPETTLERLQRRRGVRLAP
jgi:hypothetical protein